MTLQPHKIMLVDGMSLLFRGYYALVNRGPMYAKNGYPTNAIYGFMQYFFDAIGTFAPTHIICCWDMGAKTFRNEKFPDYKANRGEAPDDLLPQFELVKEMVEALGVRNIGVPGYEADDIIGSLSRTFAKEAQIIILTGDHDALQLIEENVHVAIMKKGLSNYKVYTLDVLHAEKGLSPIQMIDVKGLMGDASDNYPGVKGIGEKTAIKLITEYETIENLLANVDKLTPALRKKITENIDMLHLSRELATIACDVQHEMTLDGCAWCIDMEHAHQKFAEYEIHRLLNRLVEYTDTAR
ncbi:5'-3' exonuclease H3TH domain-containing protein [Aneurinibacillus aneurinilyticus]|uniref:5'-3' exonuclease n=1 Tax=Aneurinibacillus aneurinilyticus TaxID=1391 RepID=UPI002E1FA3F4|nr:5'-3' exonuclease H3TH domain-containing protein [Aneurinibacillus aneurinilyticus]MED0669188.1 5'-3' exonuclease H3TH domain-containing protein [Aneurinibacillus aneurinilyticus]